MLRQSQERAIERVAAELTGELPIAGTDIERHARMRAELLRVSGAHTVQMEWGDVLPEPEVSFALLERLTKISPIIARLSFRDPAPKGDTEWGITVDSMWGCWALPLKAEYDDKARARYPTVWDAEQKKQGVLAHRYVWRTLIDPNIQRLDNLDHLCRVHACCNPSHLEMVTPGQNTKRGGHARHILGGQDVLFHPE